MQTQLCVKRADLKRDQEKILALWRRNGVNGPDQARHYSWAYLDNPAGEGCCWLLEHVPSGDIIGSLGFILRRMKVGDSVLLAGRAAGLAVDQSYRTLGPALMLGKAMTADLGQFDLALIYTLAPLQASPLFKRLGYRSLGKIECYRKIVGTSNFVNNKFSFLPKFVRKSLTWFLNNGFRFTSRESWRHLRKAKIISIHEFDKRFTDLWNRAMPFYLLSSERSEAFLRWRFTNSPKPKDFICDALCTDDGTLHGYAIYYFDNSHDIHIVDFFAGDRDETATALLLGLLRRWRRLNPESVLFHTFGGESFFNLIGRFGFSTWRAPVPHPYELFIATAPANGKLSCLGYLDWGFFMADDFHDFL